MLSYCNCPQICWNEIYFYLIKEKGRKTKRREEEVALWLQPNDPANGGVQLIGKLLFYHFSNEATRKTEEQLLEKQSREEGDQ